MMKPTVRKRQRKESAGAGKSELLRLAYPLLAYIPVYLVWFCKLEQMTRVHYTVIHTRIDDFIPFCAPFVIPYILWFFYVALTVLWFLFRGDSADYLRLIAFLGAGMTLFLIISSCFPNMLQLRPRTVPGNDIFSALVRLVYRHDTETNVFPSIHVYNAVGCFLAVRNSPRFSGRTKCFSFILSALIVLSTMLIKQHSAFDVGGALALCVLMDYLVYHTSLVASLTGTAGQAAHAGQRS